MTVFAEIAARRAKFGTSLCVGIDPQPTKFVSLSATGDMGDFLWRFGEAHIEHAANSAVAVKFQSAYFEAYGTTGGVVLQRLIQFAKDKQLPVILDNKRGDIQSTMTAYGTAAFIAAAADAVTITPYMGFDVLEGIASHLQNGRGAFIVWLTSNDSGTWLQNFTSASGQTLAEALYERFFAEAAVRGFGQNVGWVVGATQLSNLSEKAWSQCLRASALLLPGFGAQGANKDERTAELLQASSPISVFPVSRGLLGDRIPTNWNDFGDMVEAGCQAWSKILKA